MGKTKYTVKLTDKDRQDIKQLLSHGISKARTLTRCRILLLADQGTDGKAIAHNLQVCEATVINIRKRYLSSGLPAALYELPRPGAVPKITSKDRARITAIACSTPPDGHSRWTLRLLADNIVELGIVEEISHVHVHRLLKKTN
jgi:transposase